MHASTRAAAPAAFLATLLTGLFVLGSSIQSAQAAQVSVIAGAYKGFRNAMVAYQSDPLWTHDFAHSTLDLVLETSAGQTTTSDPGAVRSLWHVGLTPFARWWLTPRSGIEVGIGANVFSGTRIGDKVISTAYQFGDSVGVFHRLDSAPWTIGLRLTHYSNADIKRPNPGQDFIQLRVSYDFH